MVETTRSTRVSVAQVWAVAQDPDRVRDALAIAQQANRELGKAQDAVTAAYLRIAALMPRATVRGTVIVGRLAEEQSRLRSVLRRMRVLVGEQVAP